MTRLRAKFDGKVFVPVENVDLPAGELFDLDVERANDPPKGSPTAILQALREGPQVPKDLVDEWERNIEEGKVPPITTGEFDADIDE